MSTIKSRRVQVGISTTAANNFSFATSDDGSITLSRGEPDAPVLTILSVNTTNTIVLSRNTSFSSNTTFSDTVLFSSNVSFNSNVSYSANISLSNTSLSDRYFSQALIRDIGSVYVDKGTQTTGTITFDYTQGSLQRLQVGGALTLAFSNFPPTANMGVIQIELVNGGSAAVTFPTINWIKKDGTFTTTFATYLTDFGRVALQTSGTDFFVVWTRDAGTTLYGKLI